MKKKNIKKEQIREPRVKRGMTVGKKIGLVTFAITEIVILFSLVLTFYDYKSDKHFDTDSLTSIVFYQLVTLIITWGSKASSNIADAFKIKFGMRNEGTRNEIPEYMKGL